MGMDTDIENKAELIRAAAEGDENAANELVKQNSGLIWSVVRRFMNRGVDAEDLYQIGAMGLLKSIRKFDFSFDVRFSTYAVPMIMGEIKRFLRDDGMIKVSRSLKETAVKIRMIRDREELEGDKTLTVGEIADELGISCEEVMLAMECTREVDSLQKTVYTSTDGSNVTLLERIGDKVCEEEKIVNSIMLKQLIGELPEREQSIIRLRYFEDKTQMQTAERLGISQVQISRIEKKVLLKLRQKMLE
jgi:RNA polymerase sporulation-specific sigma factor